MTCSIESSRSPRDWISGRVVFTSPSSVILAQMMVWAGTSVTSIAREGMKRVVGQSSENPELVQSLRHDAASLPDHYEKGNGPRKVINALGAVRSRRHPRKVNFEHLTPADRLVRRRAPVGPGLIPRPRPGRFNPSSSWRQGSVADAGLAPHRPQWRACRGGEGRGRDKAVPLVERLAPGTRRLQVSHWPPRPTARSGPRPPNSSTRPAPAGPPGAGRDARTESGAGTALPSDARTAACGDDWIAPLAISCAGLEPVCTARRRQDARQA